MLPTDPSYSSPSREFDQSCPLLSPEEGLRFTIEEKRDEGLFLLPKEGLHFTREEKRLFFFSHYHLRRGFLITRVNWESEETSSERETINRFLSFPFLISSSETLESIYICQTINIYFFGI